MQNSVRKALPLATAFLLALCGAAIAGDNANVIVSLTSPTEVSDVGPGGTIEVALSASGMVGVKQFDVTLEVSPADAFDLSATTFAQNAAAFTISPGVEFPAEGQVKSGAASFGAAVNGDAALGTFTLKASSTFTTDTEATITVVRVSIGPSSTDRDVFTTEQLGLSITVNPPPPPVIEPTLTATSLTDVSLDYSAVGAASTINNSAGEITFSVSFTNNTGAAASGQSISWAVTNNGSEAVAILQTGAAAIAVAAGASRTVTRTTDANGSATLILDAEGDKGAGTTSASVVASTSAPNSDNVTRQLSVQFSATWDVPVPAELASFTSEVTVDGNVLLQWQVASQSNNLGWEVYRSTDNRVFAKVSDLIPGEGTTDQFRTYSFLDIQLPKGEVLYYYLSQIDLSGATSRSPVIEVLRMATAVAQAQALPTINALWQNYPNPFNPETTISFDLHSEGVITLTVYDLAGQVIRTLIDQQPMAAGRYKSVWDGRDGSGALVGSGVYLYQIRAGDFTSMKKMTLLQ
jgi:hypothetical protein